MIKLDRTNGTIHFDNFTFSPNTEITALSSTDKNYKLLIDNGDWKRFQTSFTRKVEYIVQLQFKKNKLINISIYVYDGDSSKEKLRTSELLDSLGGSGEFNWGNINYYNDIKGGAHSVVISYLQSTT